MTNPIAAMMRRPLTTALVAALFAPGMALAQSGTGGELDARIQQLEAQMQQQAQLIQQLQAQLQAQPAPAPTAPAPVAPAGKPPIQNSTILTASAPASTFSYGGFIKLDAMTTDTSDGEIADGSAGRLFYVPGAIPVAAAGSNPNPDPYTDFHGQFSRIWFSTDRVGDNGDKFKGYVELDFFGGGNSALAGNESATNTYAVTLRHAYAQWNNWLAGQTWTNFQDVAALPEAVDFLGPSEGTVFVRQAQVRYTTGAWSFSLENPLTRYENIASTAIASSNGSTLPDFTARWGTKGNWGHFSAAALLRQFKLGEEKETGAAISLSGKFNLGASDDIRYMFNAGSFGRYIGLGIQRADAVLDANGALNAVDGYAGFVAWRHAFNPKLRTNLYYSTAVYDNDKDLAGYVAASAGVTKQVQSVHANVLYSPFPKLDVGAELTWAQRELEDKREGDLKRLQFTTKYSF